MRLLLVALALLALGACGLKKDLYLPERGSAPPAAPAGAPAAADEEEDDDPAR